MDLFLRSLPLLMQGVVMTIQVTVGALLLSFSVGLVFGVLSARRMWIPILSPAVESISFVLRAVPFYVQLLIVYFVLSDWVGWNLNPFSAAVLSLGLCSSSYVAQIIRSGINSVPSSQWEAAFVLGYGKWSCLRPIILPQMIRHVLPVLCNECESVLKSTAVVSSIGLLELTRMGMNIVSREMDPVPIYLMVALFYLVISLIINRFARFLERKMDYVKS